MICTYMMLEKGGICGEAATVEIKNHPARDTVAFCKAHFAVINRENWLKELEDYQVHNEAEGA